MKDTHPFKFYAEINIDNNRLWDLFKTLLLQFSNEVSLIYNHIDDDEPSYGKYIDKVDVLTLLSELQFELTNDCFLEFGVIYNDETTLHEVFVSKAKYIQFWGVNENLFRNTMNQFSLNQIDDLNFIDEFPLTREVLSYNNPTVTRTEEILDKFDQKLKD